MYYELEHIHRIIKDLKKLITKKSFPLTHFKVLESDSRNLEASSLDDSCWPSYHTGELWGGYDRHFWFRTHFTLPASFEGQPVLFQINTGQAEGWDISNPQFLCYVNGRLIQGLDINHRSILLSESAAFDSSYTIALFAYSGLNLDPCYLKAELTVPDLAIKDFYYNLSLLFKSTCLLNDNNPQKITLLKDLKFCTHLLDLRKIYSPEFYASLEQANQFLKEKYYTAVDDSQPSVTAIGHTHIDMAWHWVVSQTREKAVRSFSTVLNLMKQYPDYKFMASTPQLYEFLKEDSPDIYEQVKEKIKEGRWEADGGMWVEADCNLPSGESLIRQFLFGLRFFKKEFGITSKTLWLPDVFGYCANLPQIMKKCGLSYFFTTKLDWNDRNKMPHDTFMWEGIDGSTVLAQFVTTTNAVNFHDEIHAVPNPNPQTTYNGRLTPNEVLGNWTRYQDKALTNEMLQLFGFGDGGGGPTEEMLENAKRLKYGTLGIPRVQIDFEENFFNRLAEKTKDHPALSKWVGELYFEYHRGTYTSMANNKRFNRKTEFLYEDVENLSSFMSLLSFIYPQAEINENLKLMLLNQFHDILPGTAIEAVYEQTDQDYHKLLSQGELLLQRALNYLTSQIQVDSPSLVVFNSLSYTRNDIIEAPVPHNMKPTALIDSIGTNLPIQFIDNGKKLIFYAQRIPSKGYTTFSLSTHSDPLLPCQGSWCSFDHSVLETPYYKITFDDHFAIASLYDKTYEREILQPGKKGNVFEIFEDRPANYENWNIDSSYAAKKYELINVTTAILTENGPIRACLEITRTFYDSTLTQKIYVYPTLRRIDFKTYVDWHEQNLLLKVAFPLDIHAHHATYEIQYGNIERTTHNNTSWDEAQFEVCGHKWADLSEAGYGVSLLNDCKYGYEIKEGTMKLTLIKCGTYPNPHADLGLHEFTYSLLPHLNTWRESHTQQEAYNLNVPLRSIYALNSHYGILPPAVSFLSIDATNCIIEAVKKAEDDNALIIRIFEYMNKRTRCHLKAYHSLQSIYECNLLEENIVEVLHEDHSFDIEVKPYEIKTYKLYFCSSEFYT